MYQRLLVAIDGSKQSYKTLDHAVALCEKFGSELNLLAVVPIINLPLFPYEPFNTSEALLNQRDKVKSLFNDVLNDAEAMIRSKYPNIKITTVLMEGRPSATIVDVAESEECDMIIIGSRGIGGITGLMLGSTSHIVTNSCKKPVLVVK